MVYLVAQETVASPSEAVEPALRVTLFARMEATAAGGASVLPRSRKTQALLALLVLADRRPLSRRTLTRMLWSARDQPQAAGSLRQAIHELQLCLQGLKGIYLRADRANLTLDGSAIWVDALEVLRATAARPEALDLLRGPLLEDLFGLDPAFDAWLKSERRRIASIAAGVAASVLSRQSDSVDTIAAAERLLSIEPGHEGGWRALMAAHAARGEHAAALDAFARCTSSLAEIAQASPSPQTLELMNHIKVAPSVPSKLSFAPTLVQPASSAPLIGVMPLRPIGGGEEEHLWLGLAEEITTALSRFRWFSCLSSATLATMADEPSIYSERWRSLGLDFLLEGTVQRSSDWVRVNMRLLNMRAVGQVVWARRFDRNAIDLLALQDEIAAETVAQLDPELLLREGRRVTTASGRDPTAYELVLGAIPSIYLLERSGFDRAGNMLLRAVALDPDLASAHAWWAYWHLLHVGQGWADQPDAAVQRAGELAERAVMLDPSDARALTLSGHVRAFLHRRPEEAKVLHEKALSINPNLPLAWAFSGLAYAYLGQHGEAIRHIDRARQLSPFDPHGFFFDTALVLPHMFRGDYAEAITHGRRAAEMNPIFSSTYKALLAALGHAGLIEEAVLVRDRLLRLEPGFSIAAALARSPLMRPGDQENYAFGLRLAGLTA
jgi:DNA-binding SARP family transcriptional activator/TolB-like protein/Flp pilus assembly protein TadD